MKSRLIRKFAKTQKYRVVCSLKRHGSLAVRDLMKSIPLSYMGIKQHCLELERDGYVEGKRKPKTSGRGRPELVYVLTPQASELFPSHETPLLIEVIVALRQLYGTNAPEKILFTIYQKQAVHYRTHLSSTVQEERVRDFVQLREKEGYLIEWNPEPKKSGWRVTECHSPLITLLSDFPILMNFELQLYQKILSPQTRKVEHTRDPYRVVYEIPKA